jgi:hypothetical protein
MTVSLGARSAGRKPVVIRVSADGSRVLSGGRCRGTFEIPIRWKRFVLLQQQARNIERELARIHHAAD